VVVGGVVTACATAWFDTPRSAVPSTRSSAKLLTAIALILLGIVFLLRIG
jgi:hypothetical protein